MNFGRRSLKAFGKFGIGVAPSDVCSILYFV